MQPASCVLLTLLSAWERQGDREPSRHILAKVDNHSSFRL
jgi:hypothetical protein